MTDERSKSDKLMDRWGSLAEYRKDPERYVAPTNQVRTLFEVPREWRGRIWQTGDEDLRVREWIMSNHRPNLVLLGDVGVGKTRLAWLALQELFRFGEVVYGGQVAAALDAWRADTELFDAWLDADVVLLDDLGAERRTEWAVERIELLIDHRWAEEIPVIVTTNLLPSALEEHVGQRVYSRLRHRVTAIHVKGPDHRAE